MTQTTIHPHSPQEIDEIRRHKYFLSEKAGFDVGWENAEQDWESKHAEQFRRAANPRTKALAARIFSRLLRRAPAMSVRQEN